MSDKVNKGWRKGDIPIDNDFVRRELYDSAIKLHKLETIGFTAIGCIFAWFMAAIFYGAMPWLIAAGYGAVGIICAWGAMQAGLIWTIQQTGIKIQG